MDLVEDWNGVLTQIFKKEAPPPARAARDLAIVHTAISDALVLASGEGRTFWKTAAPPPGKRSAKDRSEASRHAADAAARAEHQLPSRDVSQWSHSANPFNEYR